jgi:hypothetical protein
MSNYLDPLTAIIFPLLIIDAILKGISLWKAGRNNQKNWFIALFLLNTAGILPAIYLLKFQKKSK